MVEAGEEGHTYDEIEAVVTGRGKRRMAAPLESWYAMLFADERGSGETLRALAGLTGGEPAPDPHVTIAYLTVPTISTGQLARLRTLVGPAVPIRADAPFSFREDTHPLFGYTLSLRVAPSPALDWWRTAVRAILDPGDHSAAREPRPFAPHLQAVRHMAVPPAEALPRLGERHWEVALMATTLVVSQRIGDDFRRRLVHHFG
jgi:hypothetical protein